MIWAIVLAAGESKRMGKPKLLLPFGERTIIESVIENVVHSEVHKTVVVLGSNREEMEKKIGRLPVKIVVNPRYRKGMHSSVQFGFRAIPEDAEAAMVVLGDQPSLSSFTINIIVDAYNRTDSGIVLPIHKGKRGHPVLIDMKYRGEIDNLNPDIGLRELLHRHTRDILEVEVANSGILRDIDEWEDYERETEEES